MQPADAFLRPLRLHGYGGGRDHEHWLRTFLELPDGIPSHDTFNRVFQAIDIHLFETAFRPWTAGLCAPPVEVPAGTSSIALLRHLAIDGKVLCGSKGKSQNRAAALNVHRRAFRRRILLRNPAWAHPGASRHNTRIRLIYRKLCIRRLAPDVLLA